MFGYNWNSGPVGPGWFMLIAKDGVVEATQRQVGMSSQGGSSRFGGFPVTMPSGRVYVVPYCEAEDAAACEEEEIALALMLLLNE